MGVQTILTTIAYQDELTTLYHGNALDVFPTISAQADFMVTDPPYGQNYQGSYRYKQTGLEEQQSCKQWDATTEARDQIIEHWGEKPAIVFGTWKQQRPTATRQVLVWHKHRFGFGPANSDIPFANEHEEIYVLGTGFIGKRRGSVLAHQPPATMNRNHPTEKPTSLMLELLQHIPQSAIIIDPFAGSGTTLVAAKQLGIKAIGIEMQKQYVDTTIQRISQQTIPLG